MIADAIESFTLRKMPDCIFCGGCTDIWNWTGPDNADRFRVRCRRAGCQAKGPEARSIFKAIELWNGRRRSDAA